MEKVATVCEDCFRHQKLIRFLHLLTKSFLHGLETTTGIYWHILWYSTGVEAIGQVPFLIPFAQLSCVGKFAIYPPIFAENSWCFSNCPFLCFHWTEYRNYILNLTGNQWSCWRMRVMWWTDEVLVMTWAAELWNSWSLGGISEGDHSGGSGRSHCKKWQGCE